MDMGVPPDYKGSGSYLTNEAEQPTGNERKFWSSYLDDRTRKHIEYAQHYAQHFAHGAPGHLDLMTIAKLANILDKLNAQGVRVDKGIDINAE